MPIIAPQISEMLFSRLEQAVEEQNIATTEGYNTLSSVFETAISVMLDGEMRVFSSSYSRVVYACRKNNVNAEKERIALSFRIRQSDFFQNKGDKYLYFRALSTLVDFLLYITDTVPSEKILTSIKNVQPYSNNYVNVKKTKANISGVVNYISDNYDDEYGQYFSLLITPYQINDQKENLPSSLSVYLRIKDKKGVVVQDFTKLKEIIKSFYSVNILNVDLGEKENVFLSSKDTLVVLEPDYLVDVTDIASCFTNLGSNAMLFLLSKLMPNEDTEAILKGTLINSLLDAKLKDEGKKVEDIFREALNENILKTVCYGGSVVKNIWDSVLSEHTNNIEKFAESIKGQRITVEPSFISPKYGLQGRLDVLTEDSDDQMRKDIYELKSGKAPFGSTLWKANQIQVACYNMLLESTYGEDRRGTSAVFYSSAKTSPLRNSLSSLAEKIQICNLRNEIISFIYDIAEEKYSVLGKLNIDEIGIFSPFDKDKIELFSLFYHSLSKIELAYYQSFLSFYVREMITAKTGALTSAERDGKTSFSSLWRDDIEKKVADFSVLPHLSITNYDKHFIYLKLDENIEHTFRNSDVVVLYPYSKNRCNIAENQVIKGVLQSIEMDKIVFSPRGQIDENYLKSHDLWVIEHDMMEKNYWTSIAGMYDFLKKGTNVKKLIFNKLIPTTQSFEYLSNEKYTQNQNQSIEKALKAKDFFLLQGPPGTGKTSAALMGIVKNILEKTSQNIVLLAFTNRAVEEIASKLRNSKVDFLRIGHQNNEDVSVSVLAKGKKINEIRAELRTKRVILSTVSAFSTRAEYLKKIITFDNVIIDEASQLTEIQIVGVLHYFKKFILIGDQLQLPSVVAQSEKYCKVENALLQKIGLTDIRISLFERLFSWCQKKGYNTHYATLDTHFRMHSQIADLVNIYYSGVLKCGSDRQFDEKEEDRLVFYPSDYCATFKKHDGEAKLISSLLESIKKEYGYSFSADTVGVITPWRAQIATIKNEITDSEILKNVTIDTVERFQGGEKDIIIASMAVFNPKQMSMIQSYDLSGKVDRKLNVLLSRAREKIIFIGYEPVLISDPQYAQVINKMCRRIKKGDS